MKIASYKIRLNKCRAQWKLQQGLDEIEMWNKASKGKGNPGHCGEECIPIYIYSIYAYAVSLVHGTNNLVECRTSLQGLQGCFTNGFGQVIVEV